MPVPPLREMCVQLLFTQRYKSVGGDGAGLGGVGLGGGGDGGVGGGGGSGSGGPPAAVTRSCIDHPLPGHVPMQGGGR